MAQTKRHTLSCLPLLTCWSIVILVLLLPLKLMRKIISCIFFHVFTGFIQVWPHFRPVIIVDGTFMKETYHGLLLSAYSMDVNEQIFPLILELDPQRVMIHGSFSSQS